MKLNVLFNKEFQLNCKWVLSVINDKTETVLNSTFLFRTYFLSQSNI